MNPLKARIFANILILIAVICLGTGLLVTGIGEVILMLCGVIAFLAACIIFFCFWRCPTCKKILPVQGSLGMDHCPYCGNTL